MLDWQIIAVDLRQIPMSLENKNILLGITGGIAAYKTPDLVRKLTATGANVRVVVTQSAKAFVTPLSLQAVSGNPVAEDLLDPAAEAAMGHIELAKWADILLIAPASANFIAKVASGLADDLLSTLYLATSAQIYITPAMNQQMWAAAATQANIQTLIQRQVKLLGPASGEQACGDVGPGRMLEPEQIVQALELQALPKFFADKHIVITAGPTRESIDPVRYISNHSSGKMGYALAQAALDMGARVTLITGPVSISPPAAAEVKQVQSAEQMLQQANALLGDMDIFIACAAVADYRPAKQVEQKIKKDNQELSLTFVKNPDILATIAKSKQRPFTVGFAAETQDLSHYAKDKLQRKRLDMIAANDVSRSDIGFNSEDNALQVFWSDGEYQLALTDKYTLSTQLLTLISEQFEKQNHA